MLYRKIGKTANLSEIESDTIWNIFKAFWTHPGQFVPNRGILSLVTYNGKTLFLLNFSVL